MNSGEESVFPMVSSSSSASDKYEGTASLSLDSSRKMTSMYSPSSKIRQGAWAHNL